MKETLTRKLIEEHLMSFIDIDFDPRKGKYGWTLTELASVDCPSFVYKFNSSDDAVNAAIGWIKANAPNLEQIAVNEAKEGIAYRASK